jgi:hypothetical protein
VVVGDDTLWLSFTCFTDWSEDSLGDRPRLYETVVQGGGGKIWVEDMGWGWAEMLPARGWDKGSRVGVVDLWILDVYRL